MANSPSGNSIEMQIDNFLEQFKRSASKAMEGEWPTSSSSSSHSLIRSKSRMSCFEALESSGKCNIVYKIYQEKFKTFFGCIIFVLLLLLSLGKLFHHFFFY